ncbi:unnamed protein product [Ectocarpus sp. 4 AP-2014]
MASTDRDALVAFFRLTDGANWKKSDNWGTAAELTTWFGVTVNRHGRVVELALEANGLRGTIPEELHSLGKLEKLSLGFNVLEENTNNTMMERRSGLVVPVVRSNSKRDLRVQWVARTARLKQECPARYSSCQTKQFDSACAGRIPKELGSFHNLDSLFLHNNKLSGEECIETFDFSEHKCKDLGSLHNLDSFSYRTTSSSMRRPIPSELGQLGSLTQLTLGGNKLNGPIPKELGKLKALLHLRLHENKLTGSIPKELGDLRMLRELFLVNNNLTGDCEPCATEKTNQERISSLNLCSSLRAGSIPEALGALSGLQVLGLADNMLTGRSHSWMTILVVRFWLARHTSRARVGGKYILDHVACATLKGTTFSFCSSAGSIPKELGMLTLLSSLFLQGNNLEGTIPQELGALGWLSTLHLSRNKLTAGTIPRELGELRALTSLHLCNNTLTGPIPTALGALHGLKTLWLNHLDLHTKPTQLLPYQAGTIPQELGNCVGLTELWLCENSLEGPIPPVLGKFGALEQLMLWGNKLSGYIPEALGNLSMLKVLCLDDNRLTGQIPEALGGLSMLEKLRLDNNRLTGRIPEALGDLRMMEELRLDSNRLTGSIPKELGALTALKHVVLRDNQLTALWNHTLNVEDARHEEASHSRQGGPFPRQLGRLLDVLDRAEREVDLNLDDNPWAEPPESIVAKGAKNIRGYFEDLYAEPCRVQRSSVKVILVGQEGAGKTSLRQSMKAKEATPTGEWKEESTVFADVERMELEGLSLRVYDCAGQVAYTGLLQMFLTPRAVCVLACNAESFGQQRGTCETGGQVKEDCRKLEELRVCDWLRSISRRVPDNDVILVATKCDLVGGNAGEIGKRIELASRTWLASWVRSGMQPVRLEPGVCLTSCCTTKVCEDGEKSTRNHAMEGGWTCDWRDGKDDNPSPSLLHRLANKPDGGDLRGAQMVIPRSWDIALTVLEALERGQDPVEMVVEDLGDADGGDATGTAACKTGLYHGITVEDLRAKWQEAVVGLAGRDVTVTNADNALEGALAIREFDGSLVRHETFVFLDVVWLARILKPLLNHKDEETFDGVVSLGDTGDTRVTLEDPSDIASWGRLKNEGVLEPRLARKLWPNGLSEYVLPTIASLGLTFPLENDPTGGLVVLLRLEHDRPELVGKVIDTFCLDQTPAFNVSWKIFLGVPAGAIEKVLTRCCSLGGVQTFWRSGVLVHGGVGDQDESGVFAVVLEYSPSDNELTAQIFGDISSPAPWVALSYVVSAVSLMLLDFPGLRSRGSLKCPQHGDAMPLANMVSPQSLALSNDAWLPLPECTCVTRTGEKILEGSRCRQCSPDTRGLGAAAIDLVRMVDIRLDRDVIFREIKARFVDLEGQYSFSSPTASSNDEDVLVQKIEEVARTLKDGFDDLKGRLSKVLDSTQESLMRLKTLQAPNYPYPRLVAVEETASGGTLTRARGMKRILSKLRGVGTKEMTLHFLCAVDMTKVLCGYDGEGYRFRETRRWVKKLSPVLQVAMVTAKVAIKATSGLDVDLSDFLKDVNDGLVDELVDRTLDEDELRRVVSGEQGVGTDLQKQTRASYEALTEFVGKLERRKDARDGDGYVDFRENMQRLSDGMGGEVWVRNENVQKWLDSHSSAAPSR